MLTLLPIGFFLSVPLLANQDPVSEARFEKLVARLETLASEHHVAGMGLAVVTPDGVFTRGIGLADLASGSAVTAETIFEIGSITKTFTSVLLAKLAAEGKIAFDDPVREHVPYFRLKDPEADQKVTMRDLLCHRTGLTRTDALIYGTNELTVEDVVRQLALAEPMAPFRQQVLYNNQMFLVAGLAAEHAGGASYPDLLDQHLFGPLGMESSTAALSNAVADPRLSSGYRWLKTEGKHELVPTRGIKLCEPAGAILSNSTDMARYLSFLLAQGAGDHGERLVPQEVFEEELWKIQIATSPISGSGLGFGVAEWRGRTMVYHDGGVDGFTSCLALLPEEGIGFALLTNAEYSGVPQLSIDLVLTTMLNEEVIDAVATGKAEESDEAEGAPFTAEELQAFTGDYHFAAADQIWIVFLNEAGRLVLDYPDQSVFELAWPNEKGRWAFAAAPHVQIAFQRNESNAVEAITVYNGAIEIPMPRRNTAGLPSVDEVFQRIEAAMPQAAIQEASPLRLVGVVELVHEGLSGRFELLYQDQEHWRLERDFGKFGRTIFVVNGDRGWSSTPMRGRVPMSAAEHATAKRDAPLASLAQTRELYRSFRVLDVVGAGADQRTLLRAVPLQGPPATLHVDADGALRRAIAVYPLGDLLTIPITTVFSDVREVHGMHLAHRVEVSNPHAGTTRVLTQRVDRNVAIAADAWTKE